MNIMNGRHADAGTRKRREPELTFLRLVPGDSPIHQLWPGTKILIAAELALVGSIAPTWLTVGVIAGALAARPRALVLDEPFAGLDERARADLTAALIRLRLERGLTLICVSHDRDLPPALVDREIELTAGRITYDGPGRETDRDVAQENRP